MDHVLRRDEQDMWGRMLMMELPGKRKRERSKRKFVDVVDEDMNEVGVTEKVAEDRINWKMMIHCGDLKWKQAK